MRVIKLFLGKQKTNRRFGWLKILYASCVLLAAADLGGSRAAINFILDCTLRRKLMQVSKMLELFRQV
jgi:hypothetical protein